ncbi:hypothetical protein KR222_007734 [Zaprionus bogoriensis]|nr:hypothetical protein KR222_007734 [Zaprionus bogoriensis]
MKFTTLHSVDTEYSADSVEWCTEDETHNGYFACGTYQLVQSEQADVDAGGDTSNSNRARKGRIYLFAFDSRSAGLDRLQSVETAAILDMKWLPAWQSGSDSGPLLATVNALGELEIYELLHADRRLHKRSSFTLETARDSAEPALALALDWRRSGVDGDALQLLVSDSKGNVHLLQYTALGELTQLSSWHAHGFEAWTCAFDRWAPQRMYSGGDDCLLHAYDLRAATDEQQRVWTNKAHGAGVTCLLSHPQHEHQLLTGSYDEQLRLFDTRSMKRCLAELNLNGGIWRLKPHPARQDFMLVACMYKNFSVVDLAKDAPAALSLLGTYDEHSSICYGADWAPTIDRLEGNRQTLHMATCSFYDHKLCVSSVETNFTV